MSKINAISSYRYYGGIAEKRRYGGQGTVTVFTIWEGVETPVMIEGHGRTPGERRTDAITKYKARTKQ